MRGFIILALPMSFLKDIPFRQIFLFPIAAVAGLIICLVAYDTPKEGTLSDITFLYSLTVPMFLLVLDTLIDLRDIRVFLAWFILSLILLIISILQAHNVGFLIHRNPISSTSSNHITNSSASSLKCLFVFLSVYQILNQLFYKPRNEYIINTFRVSNWYHNGAQRDIRPYDVLVNIILFIAIAVAVIF